MSVINSKLHLTRAERLTDGSLIDVTEPAAEAGFVYSVAVTADLWNGYIVPSESEATMFLESKDERLWDVLGGLVIAIRERGKGKESMVDFPVLFRLKGELKTVFLRSLTVPGDNKIPVITIMLQDE